MDKIKQVLHPKEKSHKTTTDDHPPHQQTPSTLPSDARPNQETLDRLGDEPNVTGSNRPPPSEDFPTATTTGHGDQPKINRGHHHPRQPVGATGPPPGHHEATSAGEGTGLIDTRVQAEASNNFPGTNPDPAHRA
ncbi:hypothetical protein diail_916 [Diaporthe ilicicola]|nr:hypothetical protein diail_916 [Diaporthe ilicicola]